MRGVLERGWQLHSVVELHSVVVHERMQRSQWRAPRKFGDCKHTRGRSPVVIVSASARLVLPAPVPRLHALSHLGNAMPKTSSGGRNTKLAIYIFFHHGPVCPALLLSVGLEAVPRPSDMISTLFHFSKLLADVPKTSCKTTLMFSQVGKTSAAPAAKSTSGTGSKNE